MDDVWIETTASGFGYYDPRYYQCHAECSPYNHWYSGATVPKARFNLSAYVRDQIAHALTQVSNTYSTQRPNAL